MPTNRKSCSWDLRLSDLLLVVIVVGAGQQVTEDELGYVHLFFLVHLHWYSVPIVPDADGVFGL